MGSQLPLDKEITLNPRSTIHRDPHGITNDNQRFPFYLVILMPNTAGTIAKACRRKDYSLAFFCVLAFVGFVLLERCLTRYISLPKNEKSTRKFRLKLTMWFLYTAISFGFVYQFADFFPSQMTVALFTVVMVCSAFLFYVFVIVDLVKDWKIWRYGGDEVGVLENQPLDAGKLNHSGSAGDKV